MASYVTVAQRAAIEEDVKQALVRIDKIRARDSYETPHDYGHESDDMCKLLQILKLMEELNQGQVPSNG